MQKDILNHLFPQYKRTDV